MKNKFLISISFLFFSISLSAQMVFDNHNNDVTPYLSRMSQKGLIEFNDIILPISREDIKIKLIELKLKKDSLSAIEKSELDFYLKEYDTIQNWSEEKTSLFKKDNNGRFRPLMAGNKDFFITADPLLQGAKTTYDKVQFLHRGVGVQVWGTIGSHIGFQISGKDVYENRDEFSSDAQIYNGPKTGFVNLIYDADKKFVNFSEYKANIGYRFKNGSVNMGQDYMTWGYGENGKIVLSDKSPVSPYIRIDFSPLKWLKFNYAHFWINSKIIDSNITYPFNTTLFGGTRITYIPKFFATHSLTITPLKGVDLSFGESVVYTDKLNPAYLFPLMFFKLADNNISNYNILAGSNGQFFGQISIKNKPKNTHLYATLFIDEIRIGKIFNANESRNQIGFNIGGSITDLIIPYFTGYTEYTCVLPSVYQNINPAQYYTNYGFSMGDWMGNNFDRYLVGARYTPLPRFKVEARFQWSRKGAASSPEQQYLASPQPAFLFNKLYSQRELYFNLSYELTHNVYIKGNWTTINTIYQNETTNSIYNCMSLGVFWGL